MQADQKDKTISNRIFIALIAIYVLLAALSIFLPQDSFGAAMPADQMPAAPAVTALANAGIGLVLYGGLGFVGLLLARKLGLPDIWDSAVSNRGRFIIPALIGLGLGIVFIIGDLIFSPINGIGRHPHPPCVTAIVASIAAGIGEETMFRSWRLNGQPLQSNFR
jgi:membrane protease YdiL (CAAX protease family)